METGREPGREWATVRLEAPATPDEPSCPKALGAPRSACAGLTLIYSCPQAQPRIPCRSGLACPPAAVAARAALRRRHDRSHFGLLLGTRPLYSNRPELSRRILLLSTRSSFSCAGAL